VTSLAFGFASPCMAEAWRELSAADTRTDIGEMIEASRLASAEGIDYCDALERVRGEAYARQETLDGKYRTIGD